MGNFPLKRISEFILTVAPFNILSREEIERIAGTMEIAYYPRGEVIMLYGDKIPDYVHIIQTGSIKLTVPDESGGEILIDVREEGDVFGALSILRVKNAIFDATANEDLVTYLLPAEVFRELVKKHPEIEHYFGYSLAGNIKAARRLTGPRLYNIMPANVINLDMFLIGKSVADLMASRVLTCSPDVSIRDAVTLMTSRRVSSIVITGDAGIPMGILTDGDLRQKVLAAGYPVDAPVADVMGCPLRTIRSKAYAFDALIEMSRHGISHLVVVENERLVGLISEHDFQIATGNSPIGIIGDIEKTRSVDDLVELRLSIDHIVEMLVQQRVPPLKATRLITEFNDRITMKLIELSEHAMEEDGWGRPPVSYCWMALGSEGRCEQTLRTDQDNALLYENVPVGNDRIVREWFLRFSERVVDGLARYGFPRCRGGIMASNFQWCQSEDQWRKTFSDWIVHPEPLPLRMASIFFDFRPVHGSNTMVTALREMIHEWLEENRLFLRYMAMNSLSNRPPLGFLRQFVVEKTGEHRNELDLKLRGILPIVEAARVMALDMHVNETNTVERLKKLREKGVIDSTMVSDIGETYGFITYLRLVHHLEARAKGEEQSNFVNPAHLISLHRTVLKEGFALIHRLQEFVETRYKTDLL